MSETKTVLFWFLLVLVNSVHTRTEQNDIIRSKLSNDTVSSDFTDKQREALDKLRQQVLPQIEKDYMKEDFYLRRWLEAKDWKVADAEAMLTENLKWRKQNRMDSINSENWTDMKSSYPYEIDTISKTGSPVVTLSAKKWDIRRATNQGRGPRLNRYMFKMLDDVTNEVQKARAEGRNITQWSGIINAEGFGLFQHACPACIPVWLNFVRSASERYPGYAEYIAVINVPRPLVRILRPIFSDDSLKLFGSDRKSWKTFLDERIDLSQRTPEFGGTKGT